VHAVIAGIVGERFLENSNKTELGTTLSRAHTHAKAADTVTLFLYKRGIKHAQCCGYILASGYRSSDPNAAWPGLTLKCNGFFFGFFLSNGK